MELSEHLPPPPNITGSLDRLAQIVPYLGKAAIGVTLLVGTAYLLGPVPHPSNVDRAFYNTDGRPGYEYMVEITSGPANIPTDMRRVGLSGSPTQAQLEQRYTDSRNMYFR